MSANPPYDPTAEWQKFVQRTEQTINTLSGHVTGTQEFGALLSQIGMFTQASQRMFSDHMETVLQRLSLPTQKQVTELSDQLRGIEATLDELKLALAKLTPRDDAHPTPRRTLKPPA
jgi:hypothetical protein